MSWAPGQQQDGEGGLPGPGLPGALAPDPRLAGFAGDGGWDVCPPSAALAVALEGASGPAWSCVGVSRDELVGLLRRWAALESWAAAGRLGVLRALIREDDQPLPGGGCHGDLPDGWSKSVTHEVAAALAVSVPTAENMMWLAWDLQVRLPGIAGLLADGTLACARAGMRPGAGIPRVGSLPQRHTDGPVPRCRLPRSPQRHLRQRPRRPGRPPRHWPRRRHQPRPEPRGGRGAGHGARSSRQPG